MRETGVVVVAFLGVLLLSFCMGCDAIIPDFEIYENEEGRECVNIQGIEYNEFVGDWGFGNVQLGEQIGFLKDGALISVIDGDINRNYLSIERVRGFYQPFVRESFVYPKLSADTVKKIYWYDKNNNSRMIADTDIIIGFFKEYNSGDSVEVTHLTSAYGAVYCYFDDFPKLLYTIWVYQNEDGSLLLGNPLENYFVNIPDDLLREFVEID